MAYRFDRDFSTVQDAVRTIATEQVESAVEFAGQRRNAQEAVHEYRKSCKKLRGLIRLVRPAFDDYAAENAAFRDAGRDFSFLRDCGVLIETYDALLDAYSDQIERTQFAPIRRRLTLWQKELAQRHDIPDLLKEGGATMERARKRARHWRLNADGFDAVEGGLTKSYKQARRAMAEALRETTPESIHEWRKRVKDHWYHSRLLGPIWRRPMRAHCEVAERLGDMLGKHHDLEVFRQRLTDADFADKAALEVLSGLARQQQKALEEDAFSIAARLFAEPASSLTRRWRSYWDAWREDEPREAALAA